MVATQEQNRITPGVGAALGAFAAFLLLALWAQLFWQRHDGPGREATRFEDRARIEAVAALSARRAVVRAAVFERADAAALFGRLTLDLTQADLAPEGARVDVAVFFGRIEIRVPEGWTVVRGEQVVFGACFNHTQRAHADPAKILRLDGLVFGGALVVTN